MMLMIDSTKDGNTTTGYFDTGLQGVSSTVGFIQYLKDQGYVNVNIYIPYKGLTDKEKNNYKNMQLEYGHAISSIKYYPRNKINDGIRALYSMAHPINQSFEFPDLHKR